MWRSLIVLLIGLTAATHSNSLQDVANGSANIVTKILGSFQGSSSMNLTQFFSSFDMPSCFRKCMPAMDNVGIMLDIAKKPEAMKALCQNLTESSKCAMATGCDATFVGALSNAFQFVCLDNLDKVTAQITCVQENAGDLQQECENECAVQADVIDKASKNTADQLFSVETLCSSTSCMANCYQNNIHKFCDIGEDNVLDTIFSQFESLERPGLLGYVKENERNKTGIAKLFGMMMPENCNDEKLKIKIPKKVMLPEKPKSVGSPPDLRKEIPIQKKSVIETERKIESDDALLAKAGNLSSAALMYNGKIQTLQCQFLDSRGSPQQTPDFETLSKILSNHFNKNTTPNTTKASTDKHNVDAKERKCREVSSDQPQTRNTVSTTAISNVFWIVLIYFM
ncbi:unnamed protein product [Caenorhabditis nigoni]